MLFLLSYVFLWRFLMKTVYVLEHAIDGLTENMRLLGVYDSKQEAEKAIRTLSDKPGFKDHLDDFLIDEYELNKLCWSSGF